jgi:L-lactate utilization protein LutC
MYSTIASEESISNVVSGLTPRNFEPIIVNNKEEALTKIKELIPQGASVMNGSSKTLEQIGFIDYLKAGTHGWNNLHEAIIAEKDPAKQAEMRKQAVLSDYYLGSVHALTEEGEMVIASNTGSQLPHIVFTSPNLILVVGAQKITPTLSEAFKRLEEYVVPLEDERMKGVYGQGTHKSKTVILHYENPIMNRKVRVIIVKESLGF